MAEGTYSRMDRTPRVDGVYTAVVGGEDPPPLLASPRGETARRLMTKAHSGRSAAGFIGAVLLVVALVAAVMTVSPPHRPRITTSHQHSSAAGAGSNALPVAARGDTVVAGIGAEPELVSLATEKKGPKCKTAQPGTPCYKDVSWAITDGIYAHPEWYLGLTNKSNFESFQAVVYKINSTLCPLPCNYVSEEEGKEKAKDKPKKKHLNEVEVERKKNKNKGKTWKLKKKTKQEKKKEEEEEEKENPQKKKCHTATSEDEDDTCFVAVHWAMKDGIVQKPEWYPKLDVWSSFEKFQAHIHETNKSACPFAPCTECHTVLFGEECHDHVLWTLKHGIHKHPEWYKGLTTASRYEQVQARLHEDENTSCPLPCAPRLFGDPSLFCFSVFQSHGYEPGLMRAQLRKKQGIFSCDEFAVIADANMYLGLGPEGPVNTLVIPHTTVGISKDNTAANTLIFIHAWQEIYNDFRFSHHDWTLKVDPDAVIVPSRLRVHLTNFTGQKVYVKNCNKYPGSSNWPMMFGSLEAISQRALWAYMKGSDKCKNELEWEAWGEDLYLAECLDLLGCDHVNDYSIISDKVCLGVNCQDEWAAAFHAFKSKEEWFECWGTVFDKSSATPAHV
eukprot:CAMPEP_0172905728 /NCGR_PEP_ID=MMETSP1075-20121228/175273_1 /TAXON_ID=2916 /ORGANISM="Ceratium fusus, Strain PA161109" /LENGTH=615 /DNA_ID=CAMNT_0013763021 /DNA_START=11 /DNA_END=1858 /DNA_ORIENTATION=+